MSASRNKHFISARVTEYAVPPVQDALVMGKNAPIGCVAMRRALELLIMAPYAHIEPDDDIVGDILVRKALLRRISEEKLLHFVLTQIKPLMSIEEVLHLDIDVQVVIESNNSE